MNIIHRKFCYRENEHISPQKLDIRTKPGKVKSGSPKKPLTTSSPRALKTQQKISPRRKNRKKEENKRKRQCYSSSDSDSDISIKLDDDCDLSDDDDAKDLDMDEYIERLKRKEKAQQAEVSNENLSMQELNMQLDTLPIYIRSTGEEDIEIEIIDHFNSDSNANETKSVKQVAQAKVMPLPDLGFQNIDDETVPIENTNEHLDPSTAPTANLSKITINEDDIFKKPSYINHKHKAKTVHYEPQPSTSKETMEIIKKRNNINTNTQKCSREKATKNTDTPARVTRSRSKDITPENNTDIPAKVGRSRSKDISPESNANKPKAKPEYKSTSSKTLESANSNNTLNQEISERDKENTRSKNDEDDYIIHLPKDTPRNRKLQLSSTTPIHIGDVDMIEKYLPIHGRTKRILWNKQDPEVGKSFRGSSFTISVETINSVDSMTTVFHDPNDNFDYEVKNEIPNSNEITIRSVHDLNSTTGDTSNMKSNESTLTILPDLHSTPIDKHNSKSNENSNENTEKSLLNLNSAAVGKNNIKVNEETEIRTPDLNSTSIKIHNIKVNEETPMTLPDVNSTAAKNNIGGNEKTKTSLPGPISTTVEHHENINNKIGNEKTLINLTDLKSTTLNKHRKANENITISLPGLNSSIVDKRNRKAVKRKEFNLPNLKAIMSKPSKNMPPKNTEVPAKKLKTSNSSKQEINCGIINTPDGKKKRTRLASSDKSSDMPNLETMEDTVRVTRSSKGSPENKVTDNDILDKSVPTSLIPKLVKPEKRQQKQILRKSKFKKMGIVEIADLDTDRTE